MYSKEARIELHVLATLKTTASFLIHASEATLP
jgi:hypothetical protein